MKRLALGMVLVAMPFDAFAIVRYMVEDMTCADVQQSVARDGAAILYRKAEKTGIPLYDRYVANESFCQAGQDAIGESVPTADTRSCRVSKCINQSRFGGSNR